MFGIETIRKLFSKGRINKNYFSKYYKNVLIGKEGLVIILIDMQENFVEALKEKDKRRIIANQIFVIRWCAQNDISIVVLEYEMCGETIEVLAQELKEIKNLETIPKPYDNGFCGTELDYFLNKIDARNLFLMGINASACVKSTAEGAIEKGFEIITSSDVIAGCNSDNSISWYRKNGIVISSGDQATA